MASLRLDTSAFTSILFEVFFFGFYTLLFIAAARLVLSKSRVRVSWHIYVPGGLLYLVATIHLATTIAHGSIAFIQIASQGVVDGTIKYLAVTVNGINIANHCLYVLNNFLGDSILIWRCWVVWGRNWKIVALPLMLLCTSVVAGVMVAYNFSQATDGPFSNKLGIVANVFFTSVFLTNCIVTSLTAFKIWRSRKAAILAGSSRDYTGAFNIVVESGAVYSFILMMELLLYAIGQNFVFVLYTSMAQITGIAPTGVIVLVLLGRAMRQSERSTTTGTLPTLRATNQTDSRLGISSRRDHVSPTEVDFRSGHQQGLRIDVKQDTEIVTDDTELESMHRRGHNRTDSWKGAQAL
ncbi:hypothetical protein M408DRAFT_326005 [Serendipita vermifera MAFF 305830]|uniref:Uncharacterized protein n=1 Tax=Serendipita vermifera MAFF 305830 TaxID=933852 RepID=A0A0C3BMA9_SERVB|nr:hypothetical protein M408DRAFT_326005 [Serendipita vermifera MAFF 305830]